MKVMIFPGHGGRYYGAVGGFLGKNVYEKDINLRASMILSGLLSRRGVHPFVIRETDKDFGPTVGEDLMVRCEMEHIWEPDMVIAVYCNAADCKEARGFEIITSPGLTDADGIAESIYTSVENKVHSVRMRSDIEDGDHDREKHLYVLDNTNAPAVLLELDFMSNQESLKNLLSDTYLTSLMDAVCCGIFSG